MSIHLCDLCATLFAGCRKKGVHFANPNVRREKEICVEAYPVRNSIIQQDCIWPTCLCQKRWLQEFFMFPSLWVLEGGSIVFHIHGQRGPDKLKSMSYLSMCVCILKGIFFKCESVTTKQKQDQFFGVTTPIICCQKWWRPILHLHQAVITKTWADLVVTSCEFETWEFVALVLLMLL